MITISDIHSHSSEPRTGAIISTSPASFTPAPQQYYSLGIHPWESNEANEASLQQLTRLARHPQVVAIGETGIDRLQGADIETQKELLIKHINLSEELHKPLILHVVKGVDIILSLYNQYKPTQRWIVHGFRGNATTALQLLDKGIELSYGEKFNPEAIINTPLDKLWVESDESTASIEAIYEPIALLKNLHSEELIASVTERAAKLFFTPH